MMEQSFCVHWHITSTLDADVADNKSRQFYAWLIKIFLIRMIFLFRIGWSNYSVYIGTTTWPLERGQLIPHKLRNPVQIINFCWRGSDQKMQRMCLRCKARVWCISLFYFLTSTFLGMRSGPHNLRNFLTANSTQNYFLILWHSQQKCRI